jgi:hypothetical protein
MECHKEYMRKYRLKNRERLSKLVMEWKNKNRDKYRDSCRAHYATEEGKRKHVVRVERTFRSWLSHLTSRSRMRNPGPHDPKDPERREFNIDLDYVMGILERQKHHCALTGLPLTHRFNDLYAASVDRIDSSKGHIKGNIQIICSAINFAKRSHSNEGMIKFIRDLRSQ